MQRGHLSFPTTEERDQTHQSEAAGPEQAETCAWAPAAAAAAPAHEPRRELREWPLEGPIAAFVGLGRDVGVHAGHPGILPDCADSSMKPIWGSVQHLTQQPACRLATCSAVRV